MREGGRSSGEQGDGGRVVVEDWWCCWGRGAKADADGWIRDKDTGAEFGDGW